MASRLAAFLNYGVVPGSLIISMMLSGAARTCWPCGVFPSRKIVRQNSLVCLPPKTVAERFLFTHYGNARMLARYARRRSQSCSGNLYWNERFGSNS